ncbi:hypothetical protein AM500_17395 [Bacillus sp. FJAT-18017]|uniref:hypothetical protein n=1 Tax=Bacillus sp. FJAT-18017 TaxID=1705566 RepID=UPI0006AEE7B5|nr:hypothetical protein [Bacillus sp. FJAT-18017]ALC91375.1 hypothetical protein AM500_17395 [Bacillus sp. FJAT-18017]
MSDIQCTILNENPVVRFAKDELIKYAEPVQQTIPFSFVIGVYQDFLERNLIDENTNAEGSADTFQVLEKDSEMYIIGSNPRSVLFGVYHICKKLFGYKWASFLSKDTLNYIGNNADTAGMISGKMKRRGLVLENYEDTDFLLQLIDWSAKHYINELFFTFMLWDKIKHAVAEEIEKRGLMITLGGHSMHYLLSESSASEKKQIDFSNDGWKSVVIDKIKGYCSESSSIKRISLWPADVGIEDDQHFLTHYIEFTEQLKKQLPNISVEHIAYNAGLSWEMLELPDEEESSKSVDTLFAFWGRNYQQSFMKEERAYEALQKWRSVTNASDKELTIFEYYSDHFMLGDLFPPLFQRIRDDIEFYSQIGIEQIVNLIVPFIPKSNATNEDMVYPWKSIQLMNSYFFARLSWGDSFEDIENDFYAQFGNHDSEVKQILGKLETALSNVSKWNVPLFPNRLIDPEKVEAFDGLEKIINEIKSWISDFEQLNGKPVDNISEPNSLISFYVHFTGKKLNAYLSEWEAKAGK